MRKTDKDLRIELILLGCLVAIILFFAVCSSLRVGNGCISFSMFGKLELKNVDRAVLSANGKEITITDESLLDEIVSETRVADEVRTCGSFNKQIDLYSGDKLIRSMKWAECCDSVKVYEPDLTHWLISLDEYADAGYVELSKDLVTKLNKLIDKG